MEFGRGDSRDSILGSINIVVHETCHSLSALLAQRLCEQQTGKAGPGCGGYPEKQEFYCGVLGY